MTSHVPSRARTSAALPRLALGVTIAAGVVLSGLPASADDPHSAERTAASRGATVPAALDDVPAKADAPAQADAPARADAPPQDAPVPNSAPIEKVAPIQNSAPVEKIAQAAPPQVNATAPKTAPAHKALLTADALLKVAKSQIGVKENRAGGGTRFHRWYMSSPRAAQTVARDGGSIRAYRNAPWCAMFVSWVGEKAGLQDSMGADAYTVAWARWFKRHERWGGKAERGAVVFFSWNGGRIRSIDHVGLVKKDNGNGTITTIEGNTGDGRVEQRVRPKSQVVGYGYPEFQG
ncbi:CHAP domain-containing protein [Nonomuraea roseoviolacea]|uniref:Peptidase C51 domain-containing protein n=1 Tax=Nonomuraea roseoviolacea subsp. carminata TaxID=160689 RepID=A0ABT1JW51_9ACTN|nr:CHAP domain-containing protein [Nonomuraea roseoviolacea]MCP2345627.1 hypothetical protein [Nonomuraea roseoviolacea subsp. carminata]